MNTVNPLVSVVIATYNMSAYLPEAVESVRSQTYGPIEIIIVDDGSTDNTAAVVDQWKKDTRVRYVHQDNQGQTVAKNRGISESTGEYIAFLDADDRWKAAKLEQQMRFFDEDRSVGVVYTDTVIIDEYGRETGRRKIARPQGRVTEQLLDDNFVEFGSAVVARHALERMGAFDETLSMSIDYDLWLRLSTAYLFRYVDQPLLEYRVWSGQMSRKMLQRTDCILRVYEKFAINHADHVAPSTLSRARASTFVTRGYARMSAGEGRVAAIREMVRALGFDAGSKSAWKGIVKIIIGRVS